MFLLAAQTHAAAWTDAQHKKAVVGLHGGIANVVKRYACIGTAARPRGSGRTRDAHGERSDKLR